MNILERLLKITKVAKEMNNMPPKLKKEMSQDPYFTKCCFSFPHVCYGKIEWHHNLIFGGKQVQDKKYIMPICQTIHDMARNTVVKEMLDLIMLSKITKDDIKAISKGVNYTQRFKYLKELYKDRWTPNSDKWQDSKQKE